MNKKHPIENSPNKYAVILLYEMSVDGFIESLIENATLN